MKSITQSLDRFAAEALLFTQEASRPPRNTGRECAALRSVLDYLAESSQTVRENRPGLRPQQVWLDFKAGGFDLKRMDRLKLRTLCSSEETAFRPELIRALSVDHSPLLNDRCLHGFVIRYFAEWRAMANPVAIEALLRSVFSQYSGKNPAVLRWAKADPLFSERAGAFLADEICAKQSKADDVLKRHYVELVTGLARATRDLAAIVACKQFRKEEKAQSEEWPFQRLRWMTEHILASVSHQSLSESISCLILSESAKKSETFQKALCDYIQLDSRLGDPRMRETSLNWRAINPEAAQVYLSWLAKANIIFYFDTIVPNNSDNVRRKDFWLRYIRNICDFQVAVSKQDLWKLKVRNAAETVYYSRMDHSTTSAMLMKFKGYDKDFLVAEFSETGNAAYIFEMGDFERNGVTLRTDRFDRDRHLKFDKSDRILHLGAWEAAASSRLASDFGILP